MCSNSFVIGSNIQAGEVESEAVETESNDFIKNCGRETSGRFCQIRTHITERIIADRVKKEVDSVVAAIKN